VESQSRRFPALLFFDGPASQSRQTDFRDRNGTDKQHYHEISIVASEGRRPPVAPEAGRRKNRVVPGPGDL